ncbi:MAG: outer membrane lipoprotein carrier protein LolA [Bacteroidota bacterium]
MQTDFARLAVRLATIALAFVVLSSGHATAQNADTVARQLQERYGAVNALSADFTQSVGGESLRGSIQVKGEAFRLSLPSQTLVTDGTTLWSYSEEEAQVVIQTYDPSDVGFQIGQLFTDYLAVFRPTGASKATIGGVEHDVLALRPREAGSSVRDVTLYARSSDGVPTRIRVHDVNGTTLAFDLRNVRLNPNIPQSRFSFEAPRGTETVDLRD